MVGDDSFFALGIVMGWDETFGMRWVQEMSCDWWEAPPIVKSSIPFIVVRKITFRLRFYLQ